MCSPILLVPGKVVFIQAYPSETNINITWSPPLMPNGVIIAYEIWFRPTFSRNSETRVNTTGQETSFTTENDLEEGTEFTFFVRAYTRAGPGNTTSITVSTLSKSRGKSTLCNAQQVSNPH